MVEQWTFNPFVVSSMIFESIKRAADELYNGYENLPASSRDFIEAAYTSKDLSDLYEKIKKDEKDNKAMLLEFQNDYPNVLNGDNIKDILIAARRKKNETTI